MILFILPAFIIARLRQLNTRAALREISLYPLYLLELVFWALQVGVWCGDFRFIGLSQPLQTCAILVLLWPILKFELYRQAFIGSALTLVGSVSNRLVMWANDGRMPVYPTLSRLTGYYRDGIIAASGDTRHVLMSAATRLNLLGDYIDVGFSILSVGDVLIHLFTTLVVLGVISSCSRTETSK